MISEWLAKYLQIQYTNYYFRCSLLKLVSLFEVFVDIFMILIRYLITKSHC